MLPSLLTIYLACHLAVAHSVGISLFSSLSWLLLFPPFAQIPLQSKAQMGLVHVCYSTLRGSFFWGGKQCRACPGSPQPSASRARGTVRLRGVLTHPAAVLSDTACASAVGRYQSNSSTVLPTHFRDGRGHQMARICISD